MSKKSRIDIIGQNGNTGEHYDEVPLNQPRPADGRWKWWGLAEEEEEEDGSNDE